MGAEPKYDALVINLDESSDRWAHMQAEFKNTLLNLVRYPAIRRDQGWIGIGETYKQIIRDHTKKDPEFTGPLLIVLEDDNVRLDDVDTFNDRCRKIFKYLENNRGKYSHFQGGSIYPNLASIECKDPPLIRCDYSTGCLFNVFGKKAADTILKWDDKQTTIDNFLGLNHGGDILISYPHLTWQIIGQKSTIGDNNYNQNSHDQLRIAKKAMHTFMKERGIQLGGGRNCRRRAYTMKNSRVRRSPLKTKARVRATLKNYRRGKSVGFTALSSLKSMGLVPRSNKCYQLGAKYA